MCGRFYLSVSLDEIIRRYGISDSTIDFEPQEEIFPSNRAPVILDKEIRQMRWGFSPSYTKNLIINARSETIDTKPTFRKSFLNKRCLVPANGFFEWEKTNGKSIKHKVYLRDLSLFSMAAIYDTFTDKEGKSFTAFTIITTKPNDKIAEIHHRMPVIIEREKEELWLDRDNKDIGNLKSILIPYESEQTIIE